MRVLRLVLNHLIFNKIPNNGFSLTLLPILPLQQPLKLNIFANANKSPKWRSAMAEEYAALMRNTTWSPVSPIPIANVVDCKWIYNLNRDQTGAITHYKAQLVAKRFNQQQELYETVYLHHPPGFVDPTKPDHLCLLHKSLYGLKQTPRAWFHQLTKALQALGFKGSTTDLFMFIYSSKGTILYILVCEDDIILTGNNSNAIDQIIKNPSQTFSIQDLGTLSYFLGIKVVHKNSDVILSQKKYFLELLQWVNFSKAKPVPYPITTTTNLHLGDSPLFDDPITYHQLVGALEYVTLSRPDITYAVNKVCQFTHSPTTNHWSAFKRILCYLQDWVGFPDDCRSTGGYAIYLGNNLIFWNERRGNNTPTLREENAYGVLFGNITASVHPYES
uniref:Reverse transcriptase Ty1/copia-type domain-containing protein n=1 Tax=Tanacetum cinerariifolium TaxID=118510 RepID=A0A699HN89_TANCI|nr:hypothetical protein [Tanacetum cinerariifolium]